MGARCFCYFFFFGGYPFLGLVSSCCFPFFFLRALNFPRMSSPFHLFAFLGFPLFSTNQAKHVFCWGPNSSRGNGGKSFLAGTLKQCGPRIHPEDRASQGWKTAC